MCCTLCGWSVFIGSITKLTSLTIIVVVRKILVSIGSVTKLTSLTIIVVVQKMLCAYWCYLELLRDFEVVVAHHANVNTK